MLAVDDAGTGRRVRVADGRPRMTRLCVPLRGEGGTLTGDELRALVTADLVRRVLEELHERQVMLAVAGSDIDRVALRRQINPLWVQEPAGIANSLTDAPSALGGTVDLLVVPPGNEPARSDGAPWLRVGKVTGRPDYGGDRDATAERMVLLDKHYQQPARLGDAELTQADEVLGRWRALVAAWASQPSAPMPDEPVQRAYAACDDDLDLPGVLAQLHQLEGDAACPAGAKFETFAHLDRVLALDLAAGLGSAPPISRG